MFVGGSPLLPRDALHYSMSVFSIFSLTVKASQFEAGPLPLRASDADPDPYGEILIRIRIQDL